MGCKVYLGYRIDHGQEAASHHDGLWNIIELTFEQQREVGSRVARFFSPKKAKLEGKKSQKKPTSAKMQIKGYYLRNTHNILQTRY